MSMHEIPGSNCSRAVPPSPAAAHRPNSLWRLSADELLDEIAATGPTPGGGSVAILAACLGTALLLKAFAVSLGKDRQRRSASELEALLNDLRGFDRVLRDSADRDAAAFDYYIRALRLPHDSATETRIREKAVEEALVRATCVPTAAAAAVRSTVTVALSHFAAIHDVILTDAVAGLNLLHTSAACLLVTAEDNRRKIAQSAFCERLATQVRELSAAIQQAESDLAARLRNRGPFDDAWMTPALPRCRPTKT